jgi:hypothetical protein
VRASTGRARRWPDNLHCRKRCGRNVPPILYLSDLLMPRCGEHQTYAGIRNLMQRCGPEKAAQTLQRNAEYGIGEAWSHHRSCPPIDAVSPYNSASSYGPLFAISLRRAADAVLGIATAVAFVHSFLFSARIASRALAASRSSGLSARALCSSPLPRSICPSRQRARPRSRCNALAISQSPHDSTASL